jgi:hypothetical protein
MDAPVSLRQLAQHCATIEAAADQRADRGALSVER